MSRVRLVARATIAAAVAACGDATSPTGGLVVRTTVSPTTFRAGDSVTVSVEVLNTAPTARAIFTLRCPEPFGVTTADGVEVGPGARYCALPVGASEPRTLQQGERYVFTIPWTGDARYDPPVSPATVLLPGAYQLRGRVQVAPVRSGAFPTVDSEPVPIQVVAR